MSNAHDQYYDEDRYHRGLPDEVVYTEPPEHRLDEITDRTTRHHLVALINSVASASPVDELNIGHELAVVRDRINWLNRRRARMAGADR